MSVDLLSQRCNQALRMLNRALGAWPRGRLIRAERPGQRHLSVCVAQTPAALGLAMRELAKALRRYPGGTFLRLRCPPSPHIEAVTVSAHGLALLGARAFDIEAAMQVDRFDVVFIPWRPRRVHDRDRGKRQQTRGAGPR